MGHIPLSFAAYAIFNRKILTKSQAMEMNVECDGNFNR